MALELTRVRCGAATDVRRLLAHRLAALPPDTRALLRVVAALADPTPDAVEAAAPLGLEAALVADVLARDGRQASLHPPADRGGRGGVHPPGGVAGAPRPAGPVGAGPRAARSPPRRRRRRAGRGGRRGARGGRGPGRGPRRDDGRGGAGPARGRTDAGARRGRQGPAAHRRGQEAVVVVEDGPRSRDLLQEALARVDSGPARAEVLHRLAWVVTDDSAARVAESALEEAGDDDALLADVHLSAAEFTSMGGEMPRALEHAGGAVRHAEAAGDRPTLARALTPRVPPALRRRGRPARAAAARTRSSAKAAGRSP